MSLPTCHISSSFNYSYISYSNVHALPTFTLSAWDADAFKPISPDVLHSALVRHHCLSLTHTERGMMSELDVVDDEEHPELHMGVEQLVLVGKY